MAEETKSAADALREQADEARDAAIDAREDNPVEPETDEEYYARIEAVRTTGIFGDTPTDPTTGDVVVPTPDEEQSGVDVAAVDVAADEGDETAEDLSVEEAKRQSGTPDAAAVDEAAVEDDSTESTDTTDTTNDNPVT